MINLYRRRSGGVTNNVVTSMNIFKKVIAARNAINEGEKLANSETWKKQHVAVGSMVALLVIVKQFVPSLESIDESLLTDIATGIFSGYSVYMTLATSGSVGLKKK